MVLAGGAWQGRQIVPAAWLKQSTTCAVGDDRRNAPATAGTGILRECRRALAGKVRAIISGIGWGGQRLFILPALDLVVAMNAGNYSKPGIEQRRVADVLLRELVLPAVM